MAKNRLENPKLEPRLHYVLRVIDSRSYVSRLTPVTTSPQFEAALKLSGQWLNDTCWSYSVFHTAVEYNKARAEHASPPCVTWKGITIERNIQSSVSRVSTRKGQAGRTGKGVLGNNAKRISKPGKVRKPLPTAKVRKPRSALRRARSK